MKRRTLVLIIGATIVVGRTSVVRAQDSKIYRIGILETISAESDAANLAGLYRGLHELGYDKGRNLEITYLSADGHADRFPALGAELVRRPVDLIVTRGT